MFDVLESLTLIDYVIILAAYFVIHYFVFYYRNMAISKKLIDIFFSTIRELGCKPREIRKQRGLHRFVNPSQCLIFSKFIVFTSLLPREMPVNWLLAKLAHREDHVVLEGNLIKPPELTCELLNRSSPRWREAIKKAPAKGWSYVEVEDSNFFVAVYKPTRDKVAWVKELLKKIKETGGLDCIDRLSLRNREPHVIINFSGKNCENKKLFKTFTSIVNILEPTIRKNKRIRGGKRGK